MTIQLEATKGIRDVFRRILTGAGKPLRPNAEPAPEAKPDTNKEVVASQQRVDDILAKYRAEFDKRVEAKAQQLASGELSPGVFRATMLGEIRASLYTAAAAAAGNAARLRPEDFARIDAEVKRQAQYLDNWIAQLERTPPEQRSAAQIANRAKLYGGAMGRFASETTDRLVFKEFPNLPFYPKDQTLCRNNCKCRWEWTKVDRATLSAEIYWRLGVAEHCETCLNRAKAFKPLRIVGGQFVNMPTDLSPFIAD